MHRLAVAAGTAAASIALLASGTAQAAPIPSQDAIIKALLTASEMRSATGYTSDLVATGPASCTTEPGGALKCASRAQATDGANPEPYPYTVNILAFASKGAASSYWKSTSLKPKPYMGEAITIVTKSKSKITYIAAPTNSGQMAWAWTIIKGKQGILSAACSANSSSPDLAALARCSDRAASEQVKKVKSQRPKTPLA